MNIFKRIFGKKEESTTPVVVSGYEDVSIFEHNWLKIWRTEIHHFKVLESKVSAFGDFLHLIEVQDLNGDRYFIINAEFLTDSHVCTIQAFQDVDTEYAENCAREAFDYLTKEI